MNELFDTEEIIVEDKKNGKEKTITIFKPKYDKNGKIFAPLKNKYLEAKPEEKVRQEFICRLINDYGYDLAQMAQEIQLTSSSRGTGRASADIVVWRTKEEKEQNKTAFLVIELKAEASKLKPEDFYQGYNYATWSRAKLFVISNGKIVKIYKTLEEELPLSLQPVGEIPHAKDIIDNQKLEDILLKTKEFTGDEFAKLLHECHNIIRNNDKLSPEASFDEISKILFLKIMYEKSPDDDTLIFSKQKVKKELELHSRKIARGETTLSYLDEKFNGVKNAFKNDGIFEANEKIKIREKSFIDIVKELEIYNLTATNEDVKGIAFETFLGRTFRGQLGQFFTPRVIVNFMVELLNPQEKELICDPCAGSGGFLIKAFESVKETIDNQYIEIKKEKFKEIFGDFKRLSDDDEKKLSKDDLEIYHKHQNEYLENLDNQKLVKEYEAYLEKINKEQDAKIEYLSKKSIFGTDANPRMARVSKMNMIMHGDGHNGIHHNDGLLNVNGIFRGRFDVIFTNPPFGTTLSQTSPTVEQDDKYANEDMIKYYSDLYPHYEEEMKQVTDNFGKPIRGLFEVGKSAGQTEVLFIERCLDLLRPGGRMGIVLPEGVLNSSNLQSAREFFESRAKILLIVSLPQEIFISSGATVKTSLVFLKKFTENEEQEYNKIKEETTTEINAKYESEISQIKEPLATLDMSINTLNEAIQILNQEKKKKHDNASSKALLAGIASSTFTNSMVGIFAALGTQLVASNTKGIEQNIEKLKVEIKELQQQRKELIRQEKDKLNEINTKIENEIKAQIKQKFDYEIPIADIKKAGINATGGKEENQLPELLKAYEKYRTTNHLWEVVK